MRRDDGGGEGGDEAEDARDCEDGEQEGESAELESSRGERGLGDVLHAIAGAGFIASGRCVEGGGKVEWERERKKRNGRVYIRVQMMCHVSIGSI